MAVNLQKVVASELQYKKSITQTIDLIQKERDIEQTLKKIILFCKYAFSVNFSQRKKYLCLMLIKDISDSIKSNYFQKILDENIPVKLLKAVSVEISIRTKDVNHKDDEIEYSEPFIKFSIETISFWTKKLSYLTNGKSQFSEAYDQLKKMRVDIPKTFQNYKIQKLTFGLWGDKQQIPQQFAKNQDLSPLLSQLIDKFNDCKAMIGDKINEALVNDDDIHSKLVIQKLREFLLTFFSKYKNIENETSIDRDVLIVYFHIINNLFKKICSRLSIPVKDMINLTKESFEGNYSSDFNSVDRLDMINLAGIHKYNALSIFQRIHQRIQAQQQKLGPCELNFDQKNPSIFSNIKMTNQTKKEKPSPQKQQKKAPKFKR